MQPDRDPEESIQRPPPGEVTIVANDIGSVGGMEHVLAELVGGLSDIGHNVTVIARTYDAPKAAGVTFHRVRAPSRPALLAYPWFLIAGSLAVKRWRRGVVQTTGGIVLNKVDVISVHYCHQVGPANPSRSTLLFRAHARAVALMNRIGERLCFRTGTPAFFVCVSEGVAEEIREHYPDLAERVRTIQNGVDTDFFAPGIRAKESDALRSMLNVDPDRLLALFVGSEWEGKGLEPLIRALALAPGWDLLVAGRGERERYQQLADSLGVGHAIHWSGLTEDVQLLYQLADAFVLPSIYETFSLVTFEAAASGLPILVTDVSGVRELIEDGQSGFLIARAPQMIADRLVQLGADPALRTRLGSAARRSALDFSWEKMVARHDALYSQLVGQKSA